MVGRLLLLVCLSVALLGCLQPGIGSAEEQKIVMSMDQLKELKILSSQLLDTTTQQSMSYLELNKQLQLSNQKTQNLEKLTDELQNSLNKTNNELLLTRNELKESKQYFKTYQKQTESKIRSLELQRDGLLGILAWMVLKDR